MTYAIYIFLILVALYTGLQLMSWRWRRSAKYMRWIESHGKKYMVLTEDDYQKHIMGTGLGKGRDGKGNAFG